MRFLAGVVLLKMAVAHETDVEPTVVGVDRRCDVCLGDHAAPRVVGSKIHVSVSHSGACALLAVTWSGPVGVDVEHLTTRAAMPSERHVVTESEPVKCAVDLFGYWCRKESVLKAAGAGLKVSPRDVVVAPINQAPRLISYRRTAMTAQMADLDLGPEYVGAVTVLTERSIAFECVSAVDLFETRDGGAKCVPIALASAAG